MSFDYAQDETYFYLFLTQHLADSKKRDYILQKADAPAFQNMLNNYVININERYLLS
jgi:hypothetical protein